MTNLLDIVVDLTETIRQAVKPELGKLSSRAISGVGSSGDTSFSIDRLAEKALLQYLEDHQLRFAYYSEDRGLVRRDGARGTSPADLALASSWRADHPEFILIVDPIDGTRPAVAGFESACVSVALAKTRLVTDPESRVPIQFNFRPEIRDSEFSVEDCKFEDLLIGCIQEIKTGTLFIAERGKGARIWDMEIWRPRDAETEEGRRIPTSPRPRAAVQPTLSPNQDLNRLFWSFEVTGRPVKSLVEKLAPLINRSAVSGGCFILNSSTYSITRLLTGQLDAVVDIGERIIKEVPQSRAELSQIGTPSFIGLFPYDLAAAYLIALEAGCFLTDGYGKDLGPRSLFGDPEDARLSCIAASNLPLHEKLVQFVEEAFKYRAEG